MSTIHNEILDVEQQVTRCRTWWVRVGFVPLVGVFLMGAGCPEDPDTQADVRPNTIVNVRAAPEIIVMVPGDRAEVTLDTTTNNTQGRTIPAGIEYAVTIDPAKVATVEDVAMLSVDGSVATDTRPQLANLTIETSNLTEPGIYEFSISVLDLGSGFRIGEHGRLQVVIIPTDGAIRTAKVSKIAAGLTHTLALLDDGSVWGWGHNDFGQLGDGTRVDRSAPVRVVDLDDVPIRSIAAGDNISVALGANGRVYAWGSDERRQLAATQSQASDCSTAFSSIRDLLADRAVVRPITVETDNGCIQAHAIAAGADHILVLTADGVFGFGHNDHGELATEVPGDLDQAQTGKLMKDLPDLPIAIAAAGNSSFALLPGGEVWGWGENIWGQLGVVAGADVMRPRDVGFATNIDLIAPGAGFVIARRRGESGLVSWGANASGQLGNGTKIGRDVPMQTATDLSISQLAAGERHAIATLADGTVYAWGDNQWGQLGVTTVEPSQTTPLAVPLTGINGIAAGAAHSLTRHEACGTLWSFGQNTWGQLGHVGVADTGRNPLPVYGIGEAALGANCEIGLRVWQRGEGNITATGAILGSQGCDETYCAAPVTVDSTLELMATPASGFEFERWAGDCEGTDTRVTLSFDSSKNCIAVYAGFDTPVINAPPAGTPPPANTPPVAGGGSAPPPVIDTPPTANLSFSPAAPVVGENVLFIGGGIDDGTIADYEWDFDDDGVFEETGYRIGYVFTTVGTHRVHLRVTDDAGQTGVASADIDVGPAAAGATLTLLFEGGGAGQVDGASGRLACSQDCSVTFTPGELVNLYPAPRVGSVFSHWGTDLGTNPPTSDCDVDMGLEGCTVTMNGDRTVRVYFE